MGATQKRIPVKTAPATAGSESRHLNAPLGSILCSLSYITTDDLKFAQTLQKTSLAPLGRILVAENIISSDQLLVAQSLKYGVPRIPNKGSRPEPDLANLLTANFCRKHCIIPWKKQGRSILIATCDPDQFRANMSAYPELARRTKMALCSKETIYSELTKRHSTAYRRKAETLVPEQQSYRQQNPVKWHGINSIAIGAACGLGLVFMPNLVFLGIVLWACAALTSSNLLKISAALSRRIHSPFHAPPKPGSKTVPASSAAQVITGEMTRVSIIIALYRETEMIEHLLRQIAKLRYPKAQLEVLLMIEDGDTATLSELDRHTLANIITVHILPAGPIMTKPRALNYGLGFCTGDIIAVYDAEDKPDADQIDLAVARFATAPKEVACLQGILDIYNSKSNWLTRCFTIEYAVWFRLILPGLIKLGFAIPLGGTTVFLRCSALMDVGGWDAHNVTEDADLGIRLARHGYHTEMLSSTTYEEANNRIWPWIRQRSRWLKGYMITYRVHMRSPILLLRQLGWRKFVGFQIIFLASLSQFILAPVLWSFWIIPFGLPHPILPLLGPNGAQTIISFFLTILGADIIISLFALSKTHHRGLGRYTPTLCLYFHLGTLAAFKAGYEMIFSPYFWDKTTHGHSLKSVKTTPMQPPVSQSLTE